MSYYARQMLVYFPLLEKGPTPLYIKIREVGMYRYAIQGWGDL
jgi:hypothetical protein